MLRTFCRRFRLPPEDDDEEELIFVVEEDFVGDIPATEYFPHHQLILMDYTAVENPNLDEVWVGEMDFWESNFQAPNITSTYISWYCTTCDQLNHRFTAHNILLADGETRHIHCNHDDTNAGPGHYWRNAAAASRPILLDLHYIVRFGQSAAAGPPPPPPAAAAAASEDNYSLWQRFLIRPCRSCRTDHWYAIQGLMWDAQGQPVHYCYDDPLNDGVTIAGYYRPHGGVNAQGHDHHHDAHGGGGGGVDAQPHHVAAQENAAQDDDDAAQGNAGQVDDDAAQENAAQVDDGDAAQENAAQDDDDTAAQENAAQDDDDAAQEHAAQDDDGDDRPDSSNATDASSDHGTGRRTALWAIVPPAVIVLTVLAMKLLTASRRT